MVEPLIEVNGLCKAFGGIIATDHLDMTVSSGEIHAIIGPNGAGKTTLINQISGSLRPDTGEIRLAGRDITALPPHSRSRLGLARSFQITSIFPDFSVIENVALCVQAHAGHSYRFWRPVEDDPMLNGRAFDALDRVGLAARGGGHAEALAARNALGVAVNQEYARPEDPVGPDDEVALFPPVTGG